MQSGRRAWATFRLSAHSMAMPCSAAATVLAVGALTTRQPYCGQGTAGVINGHHAACVCRASEQPHNAGLHQMMLEIGWHA